MRVKTKARDLKVGDTAFLPYFGKLMKSKIDGVSAVWSSKSGSGERVNVHYEVLSEPLPRHGNMCCMDVNSVYEVYSRSQGADENGLSKRGDRHGGG